MEHITQNAYHSTPRDYDKDPIVIKDLSRKWSLFLFLFSMFIMYLIALTYPNSHFTQTNLMISISIFVLPVLYKSLSQLNQKSEITITSTKIIRSWGDYTKELTWSSNQSVKKSFIDFFDKQQADASWQRYIGAVFNIFIEHPLSIIGKIILHLFYNGLSGYKFFDTLVIRDGEEMIAILITNNKDFKLINEFFITKGINIDELPVFYSPFYLSLESVEKK